MPVGNFELIHSETIPDSAQTATKIDNIFSDTYDIYYVTFTGAISTDTTAVEFALRFVDNTGTTITDTEYSYASRRMRASSSTTDIKSTSANRLRGFGYVDGTTNQTSGCVVTIFNPYSSSHYTYTHSEATGTITDVMNGNHLAIGVHKQLETIRGIEFYIESGNNYKQGKINIYGIKQ